jgi:hypothetical protein
MHMLKCWSPSDDGRYRSKYSKVLFITKNYRIWWNRSSFIGNVRCKVSHGLACWAHEYFRISYCLNSYRRSVLTLASLASSYPLVGVTAVPYPSLQTSNQSAMCVKCAANFHIRFRFESFHNSFLNVTVAVSSSFCSFPSLFGLC